MSLSIDSSVILQIITFLVVWAFLKRLIFDPFSQLLETRQARTSGTQATATTFAADAAAAQARYDGAVLTARTDLAQQLDAARKRAHEESEHTLAAARTEASETVARQRDAAAREIDTARQTLVAQAQVVADDMLGRCTGRGAA